MYVVGVISRAHEAAAALAIYFERSVTSWRREERPAHSFVRTRVCYFPLALLCWPARAINGVGITPTGQPNTYCVRRETPLAPGRAGVTMMEDTCQSMYFPRCTKPPAPPPVLFPHSDVLITLR